MKIREHITINLANNHVNDMTEQDLNVDVHCLEVTNPLVGRAKLT